MDWQIISGGLLRMSEKLLYLLDFPSSWFGGINYFSNQVTYLLLNSNIDIVIVGYKELTDKMLSQISANVSETGELSRIQVFNEPGLEATDDIGKFLRIIFRIKSGYQKNIIEKVRPDVILHMGGLSGRYKNITQVGWIPDMQHIELPENFSFFNRLKRTLGYFFLSMNSDKIMLSSQSQKRVYNKFYKHIFNNKVFVYKFRVFDKVLSNDSPTRIEELKDKKYVLFPASFWAHKNHQIIIDLIKRVGTQEYYFVFTGGGLDYRNQEFSSSINDQITELANNGGVYLYSNLASSDLDYLVNNAEILANPSFYEGWSTIVEEAKLAGIKLLVSDIDTHREQLVEYGYGVLFDPKSLDDLVIKFNLLTTDTPVKIQGFQYKSLISESVKDFVLELFSKSRYEQKS